MLPARGRAAARAGGRVRVVEVAVAAGHALHIVTAPGSRGAVPTAGGRRRAALRGPPDAATVSSAAGPSARGHRGSRQAPAAAEPEPEPQVVGRCRRRRGGGGGAGGGAGAGVGGRSASAGRRRSATRSAAVPGVVAAVVAAVRAPVGRRHDGNATAGDRPRGSNGTRPRDPVVLPGPLTVTSLYGGSTVDRPRSDDAAPKFSRADHDAHLDVAVGQDEQRRRCG